MNPISWTLLAPLAAGAEVVAYRGQLGDGTPVEVRTFSASDDPVRWPRQQRRLRLAQLLQHPAARRVVELRLEDPPALVLEWSDAAPLRRAFAGRIPLPAVEGVAVALELARLLQAAHRLGLAHGDLSPDTVREGTASRAEVDFTPGPDDNRSRLLSDSASGPASDDVAHLAGLLCWMLSGEVCHETKDIPRNLPVPLLGLLSDMLNRSTPERLPIARVVARLEEIADLFASQDNLASTRVAVERKEPSFPRGGKMPERLGRFRIFEKLGSGGMGEVYRAEDDADGSVVAVKTLLPEFARQEEMLRRFLKESRLLAEVRDPHVARLIEVNEDDGQHYLAVEYVSGPPLGGLVDNGRVLPERIALTIAADVCHALVAVHERGILHRDIKPDNILLTRDPTGGGDPPPGPLAKLADFGLARHLDQSQSMNLTRTGTILGTPLYLSPEQCTGADLDARSDVYSLGATLFHLLTGRPPFLGDSPLTLINHHCNTPAPSPRSLVPSLSEGVCRLVEKMLAKPPGHRHGSAGELLRDIEALLGGKPSSVVAHPRLPEGDPARVLSYDFEWHLASSPTELWPYVSNTERLNRAIHLPAVEWKTHDDAGRVRRQGVVRKLGLEIAWEEHPFEWVEGRRFGVVREFESGPLRWFVSTVELAPAPGGGTTLSHRLRVEPSGLLGRAFAALEMGNKTRRKLERVYRRIDEVLQTKAGTALIDAFEEPPKLGTVAQRRLDEGLDVLAGRRIDPLVVEQLGAHLAAAPPQEVGRIRPIALARRLGLDAEEVCNACLHATRAGLLILSWDLLCPLCRVPSQFEDTLKAVRDHAHCPACAVDFEVDFSRSVEMIFRVHPSIREAETGTYCIGGPAHSPHVVAQVRVAPGERLELPLELAEGTYRLRGPQLPSAVDARVERGLYPSLWEVDLGRLASAEVVVLRAGAQMLALANTHDRELVVRLERTAPRDDALTAARAATMALFRELFPGEVLGPGQLVSVSTIALVATELAGIRGLAERSGESRAFEVLHEHLSQVDALARRHGGALLKAVGDGAIVAFHDPASAVRAALEIDAPAEADLRLAVYRGPALAATINERLDYFGGSVRHLAELLRAAHPGERLFDNALRDDVAISELLDRRAKEGALRWIESVGSYVLVV